MAFQPGQDDFPAVCPYLGLADDADSHATYSTEAHRCYRLPNPTRIAAQHQETYCLGANHVTCPVYQGEGTSRTAPAAAAPAGAAAGAAATRAPGPAPAQVPGPGAGGRPASGAGASSGAFGGQRRPPGRDGSPQRGRQRAAGAPRPRSGGISMPVATIGLFVLAIIVIAIAFLIQQAVGGDDSSNQPSSVVSANATATARAAASRTPTGSGTTTGQTPGATASRTGTPGTTTPGATTTQAGGGAGTYTVKSGDTCSAIATDNNLTLDQFFQLNPTIDRDCTNLSVGQVVKLK